MLCCTKNRALPFAQLWVIWSERECWSEMKIYRWQPLSICTWSTKPPYCQTPYTYFSVFHNHLKVVLTKEMLFQNRCQGCSLQQSLILSSMFLRDSPILFHRPSRPSSSPAEILIVRPSPAAAESGDQVSPKEKVQVGTCRGGRTIFYLQNYKQVYCLGRMCVFYCKNKKDQGPSTNKKVQVATCWERNVGNLEWFWHVAAAAQTGRQLCKVYQILHVIEYKHAKALVSL